ncbi:hypothetical protein OOK41_13985 [Micromonospora sp. NBC_01655]|uniref:hypothetical protein n=1 Tax=Micromonospora sp. NBC_01655 TaxID=2975983 RepID=UPI002256470A|nr:hypothetical protein [Micromonospora sp. NBC_01655]MCX4471404.1 hypothetical protein [Micromonospora sp. NBC_01655]
MMPKTNRRLTRAVIERRDSTGETYTQAREGVLATLTLPETERQAHAFRAAVALLIDWLRKFGIEGRGSSSGRAGW